MKNNDTTGRPAPNGREHNARNSARKIEQSIEYMMQHLNQPLQVATLAATAKTSPSNFFALFKRLTGMPPICYFIRLRMQRACELLQNESLHVKEVAACLGYDDPFYFSRLFKSVNRVAPTEYRLNHSRQNRPHPLLVPPVKEWLPRAASFTAQHETVWETGSVNPLGRPLTVRTSSETAAALP